MLLLAAILLVSEPEPVEVHGFVDTYWYSANVSRGKIPFARPILFQEIEVDAVTRDFGQMNFYYAPTHSLSSVRDNVCGRFDIEDDLLVTYGYDWRFEDGWRLRSRLGHLWILSRSLKPPYKGVDDATAREWYVRETLSTPWVDFYTAVHYRTTPYHGVYFKSGVVRGFDLGHGFRLRGSSARRAATRSGTPTGTDTASHGGPPTTTPAQQTSAPASRLRTLFSRTARRPSGCIGSTWSWTRRAPRDATTRQRAIETT